MFSTIEERIFVGIKLSNYWFLIKGESYFAIGGSLFALGESFVIGDSFFTAGELLV